MKRSTMLGFMLLSMPLALSIGAWSEDKIDALESSASISPELASRLMLDLINTSTLNETVLANLTRSLWLQKDNLPFSLTESITSNMANESPNIIIVQNLSLNIIMIQNFTEINNAILAQGTAYANENLTKPTT